MIESDIVITNGVLRNHENGEVLPALYQRKMALRARSDGRVIQVVIDRWSAWQSNLQSSKLKS